MTTDRRQSHRFPPQEDRDRAVLQVGDDAYQALIVDQSATGFAALVDTHPGVYEGEHVWLKVDGIWTKSHVARVSLESKGVRIGLLRMVEEIPPPEPQLVSQRWWMPKSYRVSGIIALAVLLSVPCIAWLKQGPAQPTPAAKEQEEDDETFETRIADEDDPYRAIHQLGPAVFAHSLVIKHLGLTRSQLERVQTIIYRGEQALKVARDTGAPAEELHRIWRLAQEDARRVLSKPQQERWEQLLRMAEEREEAEGQ